jgi:hypothetical protein
MPTGHASVARFAEAFDQVNRWWQETPEPLPYYAPKELQREHGCGMRRLAQPLQALGWHKEMVWDRRAGKRVLRTFWVPPGGWAPRPPRGRPRFSLSDFFINL